MGGINRGCRDNGTPANILEITSYSMFIFDFCLVQASLKLEGRFTYLDLLLLCSLCNNLYAN